MRIAPRKSPRDSRIDWERVGRTALLCVLVAIALMYVRPIVNLVDERQGSQEERAELERLATEHERLRSEVRELQSRRGVERAARELGMVYEGERAYIVRPERR
jgi:cell division protein FtsB